MKTNNPLLQTFHPLTTEKRLHKIPTPIVAITGGIATGKSTVVDYIQKKGWGIISADKLIKEIYQQKETQLFLEEKIPQVLLPDRSIDFKTLRTFTFNNESFKQQVEQFLYAKLPDTFWEAFKNLPKAPYFFYEVPLLFEKSLAPKVDVIVLLSTPPQIQLARLNARDPLTPEVNAKVIQAQMPFELKKDRAHFILENNSTTAMLLAQIDELLIHLNLLLKP